MRTKASWGFPEMCGACRTPGLEINWSAWDQSGFTHGWLEAHDWVSHHVKVVDICIYGCSWYYIWVFLMVSSSLASVFWLYCPLCRIHCLNADLRSDIQLLRITEWPHSVTLCPLLPTAEVQNKKSSFLRVETMLSLTFCSTMQGI